MGSDNQTEHQMRHGETSKTGAIGVFGCLGLVVVGVVALLGFLSFALSFDRGESTRFDDEEFAAPEFFDEDPDFADAEAEFAEVGQDVEFGSGADLRRYDHDAVDFDFMGDPTFVAPLIDLGGERIREIEFFLPEGDTSISFAIDNAEPIRVDGQGIAVRTDDFAQILRSSVAFEVERPVECLDGNCRLFMWLTMGPQFLDEHPDAELLIWAGEGAAITIEAMPMGNIRDETFR